MLGYCTPFLGDMGEELSQRRGDAENTEGDCKNFNHRGH